MDLKAGQTIKVTIAKPIRREAARKTIERLFMKDAAVAGPIDTRSSNFKALPKRRGGRIWTKYPNKVHAPLTKGTVATLKVTAQVAKDLASVEDLVQVAAA
jgi:hypothetical protein